MSGRTLVLAYPSIVIDGSGAVMFDVTEFVVCFVRCPCAGIGGMLLCFFLGVRADEPENIVELSSDFPTDKTLP